MAWTVLDADSAIQLRNVCETGRDRLTILIVSTTVAAKVDNQRANPGYLVENTADVTAVPE